MRKQPTHFELLDQGRHNSNLTASLARLEKGQSYKDLSTICVIPTRGVIPAKVCTASIAPNYMTNPSFIFVGTNPTTVNARPYAFIAGIYTGWSTGSTASSLALTGPALTYSGTAQAAQPWFALVGQ